MDSDGHVDKAGPASPTPTCPSSKAL